MAVTAAQFQAEYAEFASLDESIVASKLVSAYLRAGPALGDLRDEAVKALTAHMLAISPLSEPSARSGAGGRTEYLDEYDRIVQSARAGLFCWGDSSIIAGLDEAD